MDMQMGHGLAYAVVYSDKRSFCVERRFHSFGQKLQRAHRSARKFHGQFQKRDVMFAWAKQNMPGKKRVIV